ncbi:MAG: glycosyltransferase family 2 protein [Bacteroidales bacterium]|nr:glycosyltransferase family 2 protein [Bacteroidales bacterium]
MSSTRQDTIIIIPTYNNAGTIAHVVTRALEQNMPVLVVNDGSTDGTATALETLCQQYPGDLQLITIAKNSGKGYALKEGFRFARLNGYEYVVTMDGDGQHFSEDIPALLGACAPRTLVVGSRNLTADGMPRGNTFANRFANFWFEIQTLRKIPDTQSGYRIYPIREISGVRLMTNRYEAELLLLVFSAWKGLDIASVPIRVDYPEDRVTHFHPIFDFMRIFALNTFLCILAIVYGYPRMLINRLFCRRSR